MVGEWRVFGEGDTLLVPDAIDQKEFPLDFQAIKREVQWHRMVCAALRLSLQSFTSFRRLADGARFTRPTTCRHSGFERLFLILHFFCRLLLTLRVRCGVVVVAGRFALHGIAHRRV